MSTGAALPLPDWRRKEAAVIELSLKKPGALRREMKTPGYVKPPVYRAPPTAPQPPPSRVLDRCIPAWPDPNAANVRGYMGDAIGLYNHRSTWGLPYKYARGIRNPPPQGQVVFAWMDDEKKFGRRMHAPWIPH